MSKQSKKTTPYVQVGVQDDEITLTYNLEVETYVNDLSVLKEHKKNTNATLQLQLKLLQEENRHLKRTESLQKQLLEINERTIDLYSRCTTLPDLSNEPKGKLVQFTVIR